MTGRGKEENGMRTFKDCYLEETENGIRIGNSRIERSWKIEDGKLVPGGIYEKTSGTWASLPAAPLALPAGEIESYAVSSGIRDDGGLSEEYLAAEIGLAGKNGRAVLVIAILPGSPFLSSHFLFSGKGTEDPDPALDTADRLLLPSRHVRVDAVELFENSDYCDTLVKRESDLPYPRHPNRYRGDLFVLTPLAGGPAVFAAKNAPCGASHLRRPEYTLTFTRGEAVLSGTGVDFTALVPGEEDEAYGATVGAGDPGTLLSEFRKLLARKRKGEGRLVVMANTWGDRNCEKSLSDGFLKKELEAGEALGADYLTVDDGWNKGAIADPDRYMEHIWEGYHAAADDYWSIDKKRFPQGFAPAAEESRRRGVELGLWFCPDPADGFRNWEKDARILEAFDREYGIRAFKLDGITLRDKKGERNLSRLLARLAADGFFLQLDVTALERFGYLFRAGYGIQFVENRYSDWGNYFPYRTLRNLWMLSGILPANMLQFEVLNPRRNRDQYGDEPFAPAHYGIDYLFASVMVSHPLLWFEMQNLEKEDALALRKIIGLWKPHREALFRAEVIPVGEEPDGRAFTGFLAKTGEKEGYLILFRERNEETDAVFRLPLPEGRIETDLIASNGEGETGKEIGPGGTLAARFSGENQYLFLRYTLD